MKSIKTLLFLFLSFSVLAQNKMVQNVHGTVIDKDSRQPIVGAYVQIKNGTDHATVTDANGSFLVEDIPIGRIDITVSSMGYEPKVYPSILLSKSKELLLDFELEESITTLETVELKAQKKKGKVLNEMATLSAKEFSVEETKRYAGSFNDPSRMASAFPGASTNAEGNNDIIVRGNSPTGILWRLEGIEIPNPNHFSNEGATGGPISILNSEMLDNSAFYTGAFSSQYGNASSGVFDISFRKGNNRKREYSVGIGVLGTDITAEGPFSANGNSSYLINYRYSSLALLAEMGVVDFGGIPKYQDAAFHLNFRLKNGSQLSFFGLGGKSNIHEEYYLDEENQEILQEQGDFGASMGVIGVNHIQPLSEKAFIKNSLSASGYTGQYDGEQLQDDEMQKNAEIDFRNNYLKLASSLHYKQNARNKYEFGIIATRSGYSMFSAYHDIRYDRWQTELQEEGHTYFSQAYVAWKHKYNKRLTLNTGIHYLHFHLNNNFSVEPRLGIAYKSGDRTTLTAAIGIHSKMEATSYYLAHYTNEAGDVSQPNTDLGLGKAAHFIVGIDRYITENLHVKAEAYYQYLYNTPVGEGEYSNYSILNSNDGFSSIPLSNKGNGRNYGIDLSVERFFSNNYYFLVSGSLFNSQYKTATIDWRKGRYAEDYTLNTLAGKDFVLSDKDHVKRTLSINLKATWLGGKRYTDILLDESIEKGYTVYDIDDPYSVKAADVFQLNLGATYRLDKKNVAHEFKIDIQNITNNQAPTNIYFDSNNEEIGYHYQLPMLPVMSYKLYF